MANELLSVPVAAGTLGIAAAGLGIICRKVRAIITPDRFALMGVLGAFIFAAQMVNFQLPAMPGTSGHLTGAVLLAIILGPHLGAIVISSVIITQCLIFQDGGLLALGCNIINMALVPSYAGYYVYKSFARPAARRVQIYIGSVIACLVATLFGAVFVPVESALSAVLVVPFWTFLITMLGVHFLVGVLEGLITAAVLAYLRQVRPGMVAQAPCRSTKLSKSAVYATLVISTILIAAGGSLLASNLPDSLEWSYAERPDEPDFQKLISNQSPAIRAVDDFQSKYSPMPDYSRRASVLGSIGVDRAGRISRGWRSFAGITGAALTMAVIYCSALLLRKKRG